MILELGISLVGGFLLGLVYFGGLYYTVQAIRESNRPALILAGSYFVRIAIVLTGFFFIMDGQWYRLLVCVAGFIIARMILLRYTREVKINKTAREVEG